MFGQAPRPKNPSSGEPYKFNGQLKCTECKGAVLFPMVSINQTLVDELPQRCQFFKHSCTEILMKNDLNDHELDCLFREVNCAFLNCQAKIGIASFFDHLNEKHGKLVKIEGAKHQLQTKLHMIESRLV